MARKAKDAGEKADQLIMEAAKAQEETNQDPSPDRDELNIPEDTSQDNDDFDLSKLDEEVEVEAPVEKQKNWEHMYSVLQGKYNAETERLSSMLSDAMKRIQKLEQSGPSDSPTVPTTDEDLKRLQEEYPSLYKGLLATVKHEFANMNKTTEAKVDGVIMQNAETRRAIYLEQLTKAVPKWQQLNTHSAFLKWLSQPDRYTGQTRQALLTSAYNRMDVDTTTKFFEDFMAEKGIKNQSAKPDDSGEIAPNTSGASVPKNGSQAGSISRADIDKFYSDRARGRWAGTEEEAKKYEAKIMQAVREGKVRN